MFSHFFPKIEILCGKLSFIDHKALAQLNRNFSGICLNIVVPLYKNYEDIKFLIKML